jgi:ABC-type glycerol-3-phosphate transport system substrate-binding protein
VRITHASSSADWCSLSAVQKYEKVLLVAALVIGIGVDAFFALVNFYPVAPKPSRGATRYVIAQMTPTQADWYQRNVLDEFGALHNVDIKLRRVEDEAQILPAVKDALGKGNDVILFTMPTNQRARAEELGLVGSFASVSTDIAKDFAGIDAALMTQLQVNGRQQYLPFASILQVVVYRESKVRDAVQSWEQLRPEIDGVLRAWNGHGLPAGYELETMPSRWDSYDQFVLAYYWAHCRYGKEAPRPRVAHRTGSEIDGEAEISAGIFRFGATAETIDRPDTPAALDYYLWESLYRDRGLYVPGMLTDKPFNDDDVLAALADGSVYLSYVDQMEAYALHGGSHRDAAALSRTPEDLGFAKIPIGMSLTLDAKGERMKAAESFSYREDWVFALPRGGRDAKLAYELVKYTVTPEVHAREVEALGILPLQKDVIAQSASLFRLSWMTDVLSAGRTQLRRSQVMPPSITQGTGSVYSQLWDLIVRRQGYGSPATARDAIKAALAAPPRGVPIADKDFSAVAPASQPASQPASRAARDPRATDDWPGEVVLSPDAGVPMPDAGPRKRGRR